MAAPAPARECDRLPIAPPSSAPPPAPTSAPVCALLSHPTVLIPIAAAKTATAADFAFLFIATTPEEFPETQGLLYRVKSRIKPEPDRRPSNLEAPLIPS